MCGKKIPLTSQQASRVEKTGGVSKREESERQEKLCAQELTRLKKAYDAGFASGEGRKIDPEALLKSFKKRVSLAPSTNRMA